MNVSQPLTWYIIGVVIVIKLIVIRFSSIWILSNKLVLLSICHKVTSVIYPLLLLLFFVDMSVPFANLSEENHEQIRKYLRFFRNKKDGIIRSLQQEIEDIRSDRLTEDMYSRDDMNDFADFLTSAIKVFFIAK